MATVTDGIEVGPLAEDPNTAEGFAALLEGKGVAKTDEDVFSSDTDIASGLTTVTPDQTREPDGKFAPASKPEDTSAAGADTGTGAAVTPPDDEVVAEFLAKYGGDTAAALKAAAHQTDLLGRQGQELGKTREELAELRGMVTALTTARAAEQNVSPLASLSTDEVEERAQEDISSKGYLQAATEAANLAHTTGDERLYRSVVAAWQLEDAFSAVDFHTDFRRWQSEQKAAAASPAKPEEEPWVADAKANALTNSISASFEALATERGGKEGFAPVAAFMEAALDQMPDNVVDMVASPDPEARLAGLRIVADRATLLAGATKPAATEGQQGDELPAAVQRKLSGAAVATGALKPPAATTAAPQSKEDAIVAFKKELLETETTSVAAGLTYGK